MAMLREDFKRGTRVFRAEISYDAEDRDVVVVTEYEVVGAGQHMARVRRVLRDGRLGNAEGSAIEVYLRRYCYSREAAVAALAQRLAADAEQARRAKAEAERHLALVNAWRAP